MNCKLLCTWLLTGIAMVQNAQSGVFLSPADYRAGRLSFAGSRIRNHELFERQKLGVRTADSSFTLNKRDIFGYADNEGAYRFFEGQTYPIMNRDERIVLYKTSSGTGLKGSPLVETWYFSPDAAAPISLLTLQNLEAAFSDKPRFRKLMEVHFAGNDNLAAYDAIHKLYMINRLLQLSEED